MVHHSVDISIYSWILREQSFLVGVYFDDDDDNDERMSVLLL